MKLVVISPERMEPREATVLGDLFAAGLSRYHVRRPGAPLAQVEAWVRALPRAWRPRLVLHQYHELVARLGLGGRHWRDDGSAPVAPPVDGALATRSCHDLSALNATIGRYDGVLFGPVFRSISKPGYGPAGNGPPPGLADLLHGRTGEDRRTTVYAVGGVIVDRLAEVRACGFDGVAVLGGIWRAKDPLTAFLNLRSACMDPSAAGGEAPRPRPGAGREADAAVLPRGAGTGTPEPSTQPSPS